MRNIFKVWLLFSIVLLSSCLKDNLDKIAGVEGSFSLAIPLIESSTSLIDILPEDEHLISDEDGFLRVLYRRDSIASIDTDTMLVFENQEPVSESFELGKIELEDFETSINISLSQLISQVNPLIEGQIIAGANLPQAYFPPIPPTFGGLYSSPANETYQLMVLESGSISLEITNNFSVALTDLVVELKNHMNQSIIGAFTYAYLAVGEQLSSTIILDNLSLYDVLDFEIASFATDGSGLDPFNESTWVPINLSDALDLHIVSTGLVAIQGVASFEDQEVADETIDLDLAIDVDEAVISKIVFSEGYIQFAHNSTISPNLELVLNSNQLLDNGQPFSQTIFVTNTSQAGTVFTTVPLNGMELHLVDGETQIQIDYIASLLTSGEMIDFSANDFIQLTIDIINPEYASVEGYFGQRTEIIEEAEIEMNAKFLQEISSGLVLENPHLILHTDNSIGIPIELQMDITAYANGDSQDLNAAYQLIPYPSNSQQGQTISADIDYDNSNSSIVEFVSLNPDYVTYGGQVVLNPQGETAEPNFIVAGSKINIDFEMDLPLEIRFENAVMTDTVVVGLDGESEWPDEIESVKLALHIENGFPMDLKVLILLMDSLSSTVLDSLDLDVFEAASVNADGQVNQPLVNNYNFELTEGNLEALYDANQAIIRVDMSSYDYENTAVKLYTDYEFLLGVGLLIELKIGE